MMSNSLVLFMVIPIIVGIILIFFRESPKLQSWFSIGVFTLIRMRQKKGAEPRENQ